MKLQILPIANTSFTQTSGSNSQTVKAIYTKLSEFQLHRSSRNGDVGRSVCRFHLAFQQHLEHVAGLFSLVQSGLDQCRPIQCTLVKSSQILSNLVKSGKIFSRLFLAAYSAYGGSLQSSLVQTSEDQFSLLQSKLVKSSQIQINLLQAISGDIFGCIKLFLVLYSLVQSSLVYFSQIQSNIVESSQIWSNLV